MNLSDPECPYGYPWAQLQRELSESEQKDLAEYLNGQTGRICDGLSVDGTGRQKRTVCYENPHGLVTYPEDVERWMRQLPVID